MKRAIIVHGAYGKELYEKPERRSPSNDHWLPWLQKQLLMRGILAQTPEMPEPYAPEYSAWSAVFEQFDLDQESLLVGHSCGGGFLLRWLSEHDAHVGRVVLVAPWLDPEKHSKSGMFDFTIDPKVTQRCSELIVLTSDNDALYILDSIEMIRREVSNADIRTFKGYGHFRYSDLGGETFPELLEAALGSAA